MKAKDKQYVTCLELQSMYVDHFGTPLSRPTRNIPTGYTHKPWSKVIGIPLMGLRTQLPSLHTTKAAERGSVVCMRCTYVDKR